MVVATWRDWEILKLIEVCGDEEIQALLEGCTQNKHVYDKVAECMKEAGYIAEVVCNARTKLKS